MPNKQIPEELAVRQYVAKKILEYVGMSPQKITNIYAEPLINKKIIEEMEKQAEDLINSTSEFSLEFLTKDEGIQNTANKIIGQIGQGRLFDYKSDQKGAQEILKVGQKIRDKALGGNEKDKASFDKKIIDAISHQSDQRTRSTTQVFSLRLLELAKDNIKKVGSNLFKIFDSNIVLGAIFFFAMTIALGPAGPLVATPFFGYFAYRVLDKVGVIQPILNIFKDAEKPLNNVISHQNNVKKDIYQNHEKEINELKAKYTQPEQSIPESQPEESQQKREQMRQKMLEAAEERRKQNAIDVQQQIPKITTDTIELKSAAVTNPPLISQQPMPSITGNTTTQLDTSQQKSAVAALALARQKPTSRGV